MNVATNQKSGSVLAQILEANAVDDSLCMSGVGDVPVHGQLVALQLVELVATHFHGCICLREGVQKKSSKSRREIYRDF